MKEELKYCKYCDSMQISNTFRYLKCSKCVKLQKNKVYTIYYKNNKKKILQVRKKYCENNSEKIKSYYEKNKTIILIKKKIYKQKNAEAISIYNKKYKEKNREKINKQRQERYHKDVFYRLRNIISTTIRSYLYSNKSNNSIYNYLPFTIQELKQHLESQFESWMTWENYGRYNIKNWNDNDSSTWTWNIDHIIPQSKLPYISMEDDNFKQCWSLNNLRPLSAKQNFIDGVTLIRHIKEK